MKQILSALLCIMFSVCILANTVKVEEPDKVQKSSLVSEKSESQNLENSKGKKVVNKRLPLMDKHENWYVGFTLGSGYLSLSSKQKAAKNSFEAEHADSFAYNLATNIFAYWPISEKFLLGVRSGGVAQVISDSDDDTKLGLSILTLSMMHALTGHPASDGWNLRWGAGYGISYEDKGFLDFNDSSEDKGFAGRVGIGYRYQTLPGTRLLFEISYAELFISEGSNYIAGTVGAIF